MMSSSVVGPRPSLGSAAQAAHRCEHGARGRRTTGTGVPGTGQRRRTGVAAGAVWSPSSTSGTPYGAHRAAGTVGAKSDTTGVPTAAARCAGPVLPTTTASAPASTAASSSRSVRPPRSTAPRAAARRTRSGPRSAGAPVTTTRWPCADQQPRTPRANRSAGQARAGHRGARVQHDVRRRRGRRATSGAARRPHGERPSSPGGQRRPAGLRRATAPARARAGRRTRGAGGRAATRGSRR